MTDDIIYAPIEKHEVTEEDEYHKHDWDSGAQTCNICGLDFLDYLAYSCRCKKK